MKTTLQGAAVAASVPRPESRRAAGEAFASLALRLIDEAVHKHTPMPGGQLTKDVLRQRTLSVVSYGSVLAALAMTDPEAVVAIFSALSSWMMATTHGDVRPLTEAAIRDAKEQGEADAAVMAALATGERKDSFAIEHAIREQAESIAAAQALLVSLQHERTKVETPKRPLYRVLRPQPVAAHV